MTFTLPPDVLVTTLDPRCTLVGVTVTCDLGDLPASSTVDLELTGIVDAAVTDPVVVEATVTTATPDPDPASNTATVTTPVTPSADLAVTVTGPAGPVAPGGTAVVTIDVASLGPSDATGVVVAAEPLPAGLQPVTLPAGCTFDDVTRVVTCVVGDLAAGTSVQLSLELAVAPTATGDLAVTAGATSDVADPDASSNSGTALLSMADRRVELTIVAAPDPVVAGEQIQWTTTVTNPGPGTLTDVMLTVTLPAGVTFLDASDGCTHDEGASVQALTTGLVREDVTGLLPATATVSSTAGDAVTTSATATTSTTTMAMADLGLAVAAAVDGRTITYTAVVSNDGPSAADDAVVTFALPVGTTVVTLPAGCALDGGVVRCALDRRGVGAATELVLVLVADDETSGALSLLAEVGSVRAVDADTSDNSVEVVVQMEALPATGADADRIAGLALLLLLAGAGLLRREQSTGPR